MFVETRMILVFLSVGAVLLLEKFPTPIVAGTRSRLIVILGAIGVTLHRESLEFEGSRAPNSSVSVRLTLLVVLRIVIPTSNLPPHRQIKTRRLVVVIPTYKTVAHNDYTLRTRSYVSPVPTYPTVATRNSIHATNSCPRTSVIP